MEEERVKEEMAELIRECIYGITKEYADAMANRTLSIKGIRIESDDQSLPNKWTYAGNIHGDDYNSGYSSAQGDMLKVGFVKCIRRKDGS